MKIYAPVKDANGVWATVRFVNGVGETNNPKLIKWFKEHGYTVGDGELTVSVGDKVLHQEPIEKVIADEHEFVEIHKKVEDEPTFEDMTPNDLRDWMKANGFGRKIGNIRNKEKLLEILRG